MAREGEEGEDKVSELPDVELIQVLSNDSDEELREMLFGSEGGSIIHRFETLAEKYRSYGDTQSYSALQTSCKRTIAILKKYKDAG